MIDKKLELLAQKLRNAHDALRDAQLIYDSYVSMRDECYCIFIERVSEIDDEDLAYTCERFLAWYNNQPSTPSTGEPK